MNCFSKWNVLAALSLIVALSACKVPVAASTGKAPASANSSAEGSSALLVRFSSEASRATVQDLLDDNKVEYLEFRLLSAPNETEPLYRVVLSSRYNPDDYRRWFQSLETAGHVVSVEQDGLVSIE